MRFSLQNNTSYSNINVLYNSTQASNPSLFSNRTTQYSYGYNGKENDQETGTQDYGMRIYNPLLGRFLSVDPLGKDYSYKSPYDFAENDVIRSIDLDGSEKLIKVFILEEYKIENGKIIKNVEPQLKVSNANAGDLEMARRIVEAYKLPTTGYGNMHYDAGYLDYFVDGERHILSIEEGSAAYDKQADFNARVAAYQMEILGIVQLFALDYTLGKVFTGGSSSSKVDIALSEKKGVDLVLKMKKGWTEAQKAEAIAKAEALTNAETFVTKAISRGANTRGRFKEAGGVVDKTKDVDHIVDLQLGGADEIYNMKALDNSVNRSMGKQIQLLINKLPEGTKINKVIIK